MNKILLIDDDVHLAELLAEYFEQFGYQFDSAADPCTGLDKLASYQPHVLILDVMLPGKDGFQLCRELRAQPRYENLPIIMLTARGDITDRVVGLELGADDYLAKPFDARELVARIQSLLRRARHSGTTDSLLTFGSLQVDLERQTVHLEGQQLELTTMEYELLKLLVTNPGKTFSRDELLNELKGIDADLFSRAMDTLVSRLRQKLKDTTKPPRLIKTVWGKGYCFVGR